ncbi:hypothetical protein CEXT_215071 [Caerostris extrusa]|uniref:Uncharacterized protein n=1 Tax=Caerostris extrusa TaxID=172846 RepID=A0AAV4W6G1_CAEEX|nr:hypothetical protein CEXT_215071 [Caerostris extrusa]
MNGGRFYSRIFPSYVPHPVMDGASDLTHKVSSDIKASADEGYEDASKARFHKKAWLKGDKLDLQSFVPNLKSFRS